MNKKGIVILVVSIVIALILSIVFIINNKDENSDIQTENIDGTDSGTEYLGEGENLSDEEVKERYWIATVKEIEDSVIDSVKVEEVDVTPKSLSEYESNGKIIYVELSLKKDVLIDEEFEKGIKDYIINRIGCKEVIVNIIE